MYFALEKSSADYASVAKYGHVIDPTTFRYKLLFLLSSVVVSSRAEESMVNPYGPELVFVKDLMDYDFVYLALWGSGVHAGQAGEENQVVLGEHPDGA